GGFPHRRSSARAHRPDHRAHGGLARSEQARRRAHGAGDRRSAAHSVRLRGQGDFQPAQSRAGGICQGADQAGCGPGAGRAIESGDAYSDRGDRQGDFRQQAQASLRRVDVSGNLELQTLLALSDHLAEESFMAQESASVETSKLPKGVALDWQRGGLRWKISATFSGLILALGLLVIGIVYYFTNAALQKQVDLRSAAIATNLADAAAGLVSRKSSLELDALVAKYGRLDGVAYAFVQDAK